MWCQIGGKARPPARRREGSQWVSRSTDHTTAAAADTHTRAIKAMSQNALEYKNTKMHSVSLWNMRMQNATLHNGRMHVVRIHRAKMLNTGLHNGRMHMSRKHRAKMLNTGLHNGRIYGRG